jgi:hypothetical protein
MAIHDSLDFQCEHYGGVEYLHGNWNVLLPGEVRFWINAVGIRLDRVEVRQLMDFLVMVHDKMDAHRPSQIGWMGTSGTDMESHDY